MEGPKVGATLQAAVSVSPLKSQVYLVVLAIIGAGSLAFGFFLLQQSNSSAWMPVAIGVVILLVSFFGWLVAQRDTDLESAIPTTIVGPEGLSLSTDARVLGSRNKVMQLASLLTIVAQRQPLPAPQGLVDDAGAPIPESHGEAQSRVDVANRAAQECTSAAIAELRDATASTSAIQERVEYPKSDALMETNIAPSVARDS